jgi:uncharacterized protein (DUF2235 family)
MPKNIVLFIDGTWNEKGHALKNEDTNVHKLWLDAKGHPDQVCEHLDGIGTDLGRRVVGGLFGSGMSDLVKKAYRFLSTEYVEGDCVYLFGFSRGAFAARSVAGFVDAVGLLLQRVASEDKLNELAYDNLIETAYAIYENGTDRDQSPIKEYLRDLHFSEGRPSTEDGTVLPIYFLGVWDTVPALGLPGRTAMFSAPFTEHHMTGLPGNVTFARHALALHELRRAYRPLLWESCDPTERWVCNESGTGYRPKLQQMWFAGAHSDVGGGYRKREWSDVTLDWMASEARESGLRLRDWPRKVGRKLPDSMIHNPIQKWSAFALPSRTVDSSSIGLKWQDYFLFRVRAELSNPPTEAESTFKVHPSAIERLPIERQTRYAFISPGVNKCLRSVDIFTLAMFSRLGVAEPTTERIAAIEEFWRDEGWDSVSFCEDLTAFVNAGGRPSATEGESFVRALFVQLVTGRAPLPELHAAICEAVAHSLDEFTESRDRTRADDLTARLRDIPVRVRGAVLALPDEFAEPLESFVGAVETNANLFALRIPRILVPPVVIKKSRRVE